MSVCLCLSVPASVCGMRAVPCPWPTKVASYPCPLDPQPLCIPLAVGKFNYLPLISSFVFCSPLLYSYLLYGILNCYIYIANLHTRLHRQCACLSLCVCVWESPGLIACVWVAFDSRKIAEQLIDKVHFGLLFLKGGLVQNYSQYTPGDKSFLAAKRENSIFKHCSWAGFVAGLVLASTAAVNRSLAHWNSLANASTSDCVMACMWHVTVNCYGFCQFKLFSHPSVPLSPEKSLCVGRKINALESNFRNCFRCCKWPKIYLSEMCQCCDLYDWYAEN